MVQEQKAYTLRKGISNLLRRPIIAQRAPTSSDTGYSLGQVWVDNPNQSPYMLSAISSGNAVWTLLGVGTSGDVDSLTSNSGGAVGPTGAGTINVLGGTNITGVGVPGTSTITLNLDAAISLATSVTTPLLNSVGTDLDISCPSGFALSILAEDQIMLFQNSTGPINVFSGALGATAIVITATAAAGGVQVNAKQGGLSLDCVGGQTNISTSDALTYISSTGAAAPIQIRANDGKVLLQGGLASDATAVTIQSLAADGGITLISGTAGVNLTSPFLHLSSSASQIRQKGGAATDFIGTATLTAGTVTIANTNIASTDRVFISRSTINASTAIGELTWSAIASTSFTITAVQPGTPAATETNDVSTVFYWIVRQS